MIFLRMISCRSSQPTLTTTFTLEEYHYEFPLQVCHKLTTRLNALHKGPS